MWEYQIYHFISTECIHKQFDIVCWRSSILFCWSLKSLGEIFWKHSVVVNVTIFGSGGEAHSIWVEGDWMNSTEMTLDVGEHLVVNNIIKLNIETTLLCSSRGDILCILSSAHQDVELLILIDLIQWADWAISAWEIELVISNFIKSIWMEQFACAITGASKQHREVTSDCDRKDFVLVNISYLLNAFLLQIVLDKSTSIGAIVNARIKWAPLDTVDLVIFWSVDGLDCLSWLCHSISHHLLQIKDL